jgi:hypothetical protein
MLEFATLGEYGVPGTEREPDLDRFELERALPREPAIVRIGRARPDKVRPATAAARLREQTQIAPRPTSTRVALRSMALAGGGAASRQPQPRTRGGVVRPAPQPCLVADAQRS